MDRELNSSFPDEQKIAIIAGAGPAGLTAAVELLRQTDIKPIVLEASDKIGGLAQTINHNGNRIDIGGHRFFSRNKEITNWWYEFLPLQGQKLKDGKTCTLMEGGPNPEKEDNVMLSRKRLSRIFYKSSYINYPISFNFDTLKSIGFGTSIKIGLGYIWACIHKLPEDSLENYYVNRFGRPLYDLFFKDYTEKVWGLPPIEIGAEWGSQRVKGLSITSLVADFVRSILGKKNTENSETSLIEEFLYPKFGPGQLWEVVAEEILKNGGEILLNHSVCEVDVANCRVTDVVATTKNGIRKTIHGDYFISTIPIKDLIPSMKGMVVPTNILEAANNLPYRDFITVGLCVRQKCNVPDTWIYIQNPCIKVARLQIFNNWSPYLVADYENTTWIGMEFLCSEGDDFWNLSDHDIIELAKDELARTGVILPADFIDSCCIRIKKAYPSYSGSYNEMGEIQKFLDNIPNLFCIGRNGQHRYNNMDHSMLSAMECVKNIKTKSSDKSNVWGVNTDAEYNERRN